MFDQGAGELGLLIFVFGAIVALRMLVTGIRHGERKLSVLGIALMVLGLLVALLFSL